VVGLLLAVVPCAARATEPTAAATAPEPASEIEGPMRPDAQALYDRALSRFSTRDYAAAIGDLEAGYRLEPRRDFLFAEAQAKRLGGDCAGAVGLYQRFLQSGPPAVQTSAAQIALGRCAQELASRPQVVVTVPAPIAPRPPPPEWWRDPAGLALSAGAVVGAGVGIGYLIAALSARSDAGGATTVDEYSRRWSVATTRRDVAIGAFVAGGALAAAGIARFAIVRRRAGSGPIALWLGPGVLELGGNF
jgi:hypothetical protein